MFVYLWYTLWIISAPRLPRRRDWAVVLLLFFSFCLFCQSFYLSVHLSVCLFICLSIFSSIFLSVYLSLCPSVSVPVLSVCLLDSKKGPPKKSPPWVPGRWSPLPLCTPETHFLHFFCCIDVLMFFHYCYLHVSLIFVDFQWILHHFSDTCFSCVLEGVSSDVPLFLISFFLGDMRSTALIQWF